MSKNIIKLTLSIYTSGENPTAYIVKDKIVGWYKDTKGRQKTYVIMNGQHVQVEENLTYIEAEML